jgi:hypothetical protein
VSTTFKEELAKVNQKLETVNKEIAATPKSEPVSAPSWWTTTNAMTMSSIVLVFGFLTLALAAAVLSRGYSWEAVLKTLGTVLIIILTVFLIVAGYDDKQIAPAVGLLGTIAGYLLGKEPGDRGAKIPAASPSKPSEPSPGTKQN